MLTITSNVHTVHHNYDRSSFYEWWRSIILLLLVCFLLFINVSDVIVIGVVTAQASTTTRQSFPYLYAQINDFNASYPVREHIHPSHFNINDNQDSNALQVLNRPDFLFTKSTATNTYRVVEFYVHWCDVCKHFKSHYILLGQRIQELLLLQPPPPSSSSLDGMGNTQSGDVRRIVCSQSRFVSLLTY
jgi:hypothetical protein